MSIVENIITKEAFEALYKQFYPIIYRLCLGYVYGNRSIAEDLTHEAFLIVWDKRNSFKNESAISTWVYRISINVCLMYIRKEKKQPTALNVINTNIADNESGSSHEACEELYRCMEKLEEADKLLMMLILEEIPGNEIAQILGISEVNVRVKTHRLKEKLRKYFN